MELGQHAGCPEFILSERAGMEMLVLDHSYLSRMGPVHQPTSHWSALEILFPRV